MTIVTKFAAQAPGFSRGGDSVWDVDETPLRGSPAGRPSDARWQQPEGVIVLKNHAKNAANL